MSESNRRKRSCSPLHDHSATQPKERQSVALMEDECHLEIGA